MRPYTFYVVDDDDFVRNLHVKLLTDSGHRVMSSRSSVAALAEIQENPPDCVITDIMMPQMDGFELVQRLRKNPALEQTRIVVASSKAFDFDRRRARDLGANGYLQKPVPAADFVRSLVAIIEDKLELAYFGVRGTLPVPGERSTRYGGNTSCVTLRLQNDRLFILDAGSGIKRLSGQLMAAKKRVTGKIFITHPHWDHINALPYFAPLYVQGNEFGIYGASHGDQTMQDLIAAQMDGVYFPITIREFAARVYFRDLREETLMLDGLLVETMLLNHPGTCLGYRFTYEGRSVCYITDNELYFEDMPQYDQHFVNRLTDFVRSTDVLIIDTNYMDDVYRQRVGWGHSSITPVCQLAAEAEVKQLHLFHHDPDQTDDDIDRKLDLARDKLMELGSFVEVRAPAEGSTVIL
ncbi:MAG: response regulator [Alphaproteobacteria bacterium]|nr:response regulator [Alphaproteobacteria bacterium]